MRKEPQLIRLDMGLNNDSISKKSSTVLQSWRIFISNLQLSGLIGIHPIEKIEPQPIIINISAMYCSPVPQEKFGVEQVVCYQKIVNNIEQLVINRHIMFVENLAEEIADNCLEDSRVSEVSVRVEKPNAIEKAIVGVEITRQRLV